MLLRSSIHKINNCLNIYSLKEKMFPFRKRQHSFLKEAFIFFLLCCNLACEDNQTIYNVFQPIENATWTKEKTFYFTFEIEDPSTLYDLTLELRNNSLYPYRNLWMIQKEEQPVGPLLRDTIECVLADEFGKWTGKGFSLYTSSFPLKQNYRFPYTGRYTFSFKHVMTDKELKGIHEIGFRVEKSSQPLSPGSIQPEKDKK